MTTSAAINSARVPSNLGPQSLSVLPPLALREGDHEWQPPVKRIHSDHDVTVWIQSEAHRHLILFLARLCEAVVGKATVVRRHDDVTSTVAQDAMTPIDRVWQLLDQLQTWTAQIEPLKTPQRFGNLAFRAWGQRLETEIRTLHLALLPQHLHYIAPEVEAYLLGSFGSWTRLDYGSGHELSFLAWLSFLSRAGVFDDPIPSTHNEKAPDTASPTDVERRLALEIMPKYLEVAWGVQDRYGLEPAGSHGVWGLDDYQFIPYCIGAAQLRVQTAYTPLAVTSASHKPSTLPITPFDLLCFVPTSSTLSLHSNPLAGPPFANLYTSSIARIHALKRGPFHEHSPILHDVATTVPNWVKVHTGMLKMWQAECLGKRPVVQHFPFGDHGFPWPIKAVLEAGTRQTGETPRTVPGVQQPSVDGAGQRKPAMAPTAAPWSRMTASNATPMPPTSAPWARPSVGTSLGHNQSIASSSTTMRSTIASTGSAAAASSPFGVLPRTTSAKQPPSGGQR